MHDSLQKIEEASQGLQYLSEADYPFEVVLLEEFPGVPHQQLLSRTDKEAGAPVEKVDLTWFFRNQVKVYPESTPEQRDRAQRFQHLQQVLEQELTGIEVYRIGEIDIDAFIVGRLKDGRLAGLRTRLIET